MNKQSVFLYGPSGSGKSTLGKILAQNLNIPFVDLDEEIETRGGVAIPEIFASQGEASFRAKERQTLSVILKPKEQVIALGGGALTTPECRNLAEASGQIILLNASTDTLLARLQADTVVRPLLAGDARENLSRLLAKREAHYASFPIKVDTSAKTPQDIAWEIQVLLGMFHVCGMATRQNPGYDVRVQAGGLHELGAALKQRGLRGPVAIVTDENVGELYLARVTESLTKVGFETQWITLPPGEHHKTLDTVSKLWDGFLTAKIERGSTIVGLGGGVVGDLTGFAASSYLRGVPWVAVPTTILAMVDASLGGKTGADLPQGKNLIGAFYPPRLVLADPTVLQTLPEAEFTSGMAEVIKHGIIGDAQLLENLPGFGILEGLGKIIRRGMAVKVRVIEEDPYEKGLRAALNYGHTVGHGVELVSGFKVRHGEAVAIGTLAEARMAEQIGLAQPGLAEQISALLETAGLPSHIPPGLDREKIIAAMQHDKKKADGIVRFALPAAIGDVHVGVEVSNWETVIRGQ
jgi:shikimate kinase / 3-dehydroquinate synthase